MSSVPTPSNPEVPTCLLCGQATKLLYPSNVDSDEPLHSGEVACTSPHLSVHDDIYICRSCGLGRSIPPLGIAEIDELYREVEDPNYYASEEERRASFRESLEGIENYRRPPGRLLEVGSSVGLFLQEAGHRGWTATGIEPSVWAAEQARGRGLDVYNGTLDGFDGGPAQFDVVALWDVLEHLVDPVAGLRCLNGLLKPGAILGLTTINIGGLGARLLRGRWPWLMRMHLHYFTRRSLTEVVSREGYEILHLATQPKVLKLGYLVGRARGMLGPLARSGEWTVERLGLADRPVKVDFGDILLLIARKKMSPGTPD